MNVTATLGGTASRKRRPAAVISRARTAVLLLGLTAIIIGILGMHIWIGSHNPGHSASAAAVAAAPEAGHHHLADGTAAVTDHGLADMAADGCAGCGEHELAAGMCVLALFMVGAAGLIRPGSGLLLSAAGLRGPPRTVPPRAAPSHPPSLIQLSISRT